MVSVGDTILAFAECRNRTEDHCYPTGESVLHAPTRICMRRSTSGGANWSDLQILPTGGNAFSQTVVAVGNKVLVHYTFAGDSLSTDVPTTLPTFQLSSTSQGASWDSPTSLPPALGDCGHYQGGRYGTVARAPGGGKRLLISAYNASSVDRPACIYGSDDIGQSWRLMTYMTQPAPNVEVAIVAVGNGSIVYANGRHHICANPHRSFPAPRVSGFSTDSGASFSLELSSSPAGDCDCNGAAFPLLSVGSATVLLAGPAGPPPEPNAREDTHSNNGRRKMLVHKSTDGARSWGKSPLLVESGYAGYSAMSLVPSPPAAALLYESGGTSKEFVEKDGCLGSCEISFVRLPDHFVS